MNNTTKTNQYLRAVLLLSRGRYMTVKELAEELGLDLRTVYRYVDDLNESSFFQFDRRGKRLRISRESLFWVSVSHNMYLTDQEAMALSNLLEPLDIKGDRHLLSLKRKVADIVGNYIEPLKEDAEVRLVENVALIQSAIENHRMVFLRGYTSLHSDTKTDRLVEPFLFLDSHNDVRCYELTSQMNKTFKLSRCETVEVLDVEWQFVQRHKKMFTDIFHFSDETTTRVRLLLGNRAKTILLEEHPEAKQYLIPHPDGRWMLDAEYCSMKGIGRFYLGLFEDIEIVDSPEFSQYLTERIKSLTNRV